MSVLPILLYWSLALWGLFSPRPVLLWLFFGVLPFGATAIVPTGLTGGLSLVGSTMTALLIVLRQFLLYRRGPEKLVALALRGEGVPLFLFWCIGVVVTLFAPRVFAGLVTVSPMTPTGFMQPELLRPTAQNISQLAYVTVSVFAVFAFAAIFGRDARLETLPGGLLLAGAVTVATGLLDYYSATAVLAPFRTANYAIIDNAFIFDGSKRVTGLMPEASVFGNLVIALLSCLWFLRHAMATARQKLLFWPVAGGLAMMLAVSTSSAGYVGIAILCLLVLADWTFRALRLGPQGGARTVRAEFMVVLGLVAALAVAIVAVPALFDPAIERIRIMVFDKTESASYLERSWWTRASVEAGLSSYMIGVGLGSTRASNFAAVIFGSVGLAGFLFYFGFVLRRLAQPALQPAAQGHPRAGTRRQVVLRAMKWSFWPPFAISLLIGTTPDFGVFEALRWGSMLALAPVAAGVARSRRRSASGAGDGMPHLYPNGSFPR